MNSEKLAYYLTSHPDTLKFWYSLRRTHIDIPKVKRKYASELALWYQKLVSTASRKIREWENLHRLSNSCTPGCSDCCYHPVVITRMEGLIIYTFVIEHHLEHFFAKILNITRTIEEKLPKLPSLDNEKLVQEFRKKYFDLRIPCPFLFENKCVIYPVRPTNCVTYLFYGDPSTCKSDSSPALGVQFNAVEAWMLYEMRLFVEINRTKVDLRLLNSEIALLPIQLREFGNPR